MKSIFLSLAIAVAAHAKPPEKFWGALHIVESGGGLGAIKGDFSARAFRALGPLQIHRAYWSDSRVPGRYQDCADLAYSRRVVTAYLQRYAPKAWAAGESGCDVLFRTHNGGPGAMKATGQKKKNLDRYSQRALGLMQ